MFPERFVDYEPPEMTEEEMVEFFAKEPEEEWSGNVSWIDPRREKTGGNKSKKRKKKLGIDQSKDVIDSFISGEQIAESGAKDRSDSANIFIDEEKTKVKTVEGTSEAVCGDQSRDTNEKKPRDGRVKNAGVPTFRATCYRGTPSGEKHAFTSQDAAKVFGGAIQRYS